MNNIITAVIFRFNPEKDREPRYQEYRVTGEEEMSALALLDRIQKEIDGTLGFRSYCCGLQMCGSCLMRIDGKKKFACLTLVKPGDRVTLEPLTYPEGHIRDLVVRRPEQETEEHQQSQTEERHDHR